MNLQFVKFEFIYFVIYFLNLDHSVHRRSIFQNNDNMIFCDMEKSFGNQKKNDKFCGK